MRGTTRITRVLAAFVAVTLAGVAPGAVTSRAHLSTGGLEGRSVLIKIFAPHDSHAVAAPSVAAPQAPFVHVPKSNRTIVAAVPPSLPVSSPGVWSVQRDVTPDGGTNPNDAFLSQSSDTCAHATTCPDFQLRPARWPTDKNGTATITWKFNDAGRRDLRAPPGLLESAVSSAMASWSHFDSNIVFKYAGTTTANFGDTGKDGSCADGTNVITWARFDADIIAEAGICTDASGRIVRGADLAMNVTYHWEDIQGTPQSRHSMDIRSIVTHELGHWLGLLDLYSQNDIHQTMSGYSQYGETRKRTPALGDIIGIQTAFPCDKGDSCPRTGIADD